MAATIDLREAFEIAKIKSHVAHLDISKIHLSHKDLSGPTKISHDMAISDPVHSETSKYEGKYESLPVASGASGRVIEAFTMLQESPRAQDVVASLVSDMNVWGSCDEKWKSYAVLQDMWDKPQ